jgi:hypothetical protein
MNRFMVKSIGEMQAAPDLNVAATRRVYTAESSISARSFSGGYQSA